MALTEFQRRICRLLAERRKSSGESYVAGAAALNELIGGKRISHDVDLFHDTEEAVAVSWDFDSKLLVREGFDVTALRERPGYVDAEIKKGDDHLRLEYTRDSAFRFFPLQTHADFGLTLHPFDLATNKVLALVGRLELRDWIDVISIDQKLQPLGYLAWAACAKDPGFTPKTILEHAARANHFTQPDVNMLMFERPPDLASLRVG